MTAMTSRPASHHAGEPAGGPIAHDVPIAKVMVVAIA